MHLARFSSSEQGLRRVLERRIARWARQLLGAGAEPEGVRTAQQQALADARTVVAELAASGAVSDAGFAEQRARALSRGGRSQRAITAHLGGHGIDPGQAAQAVRAARGEMLADGAEAELAAALVAARKRRIGPFAPEIEQGAADAMAMRRRALGTLARAGFAQDVVQRALACDRESADALIARLRAG